MKQITIKEQISQELEIQTNFSWKDIAGLSWIFLDDDIEEFYFTKEGEV